ncbi:MAG: M1 family aminopeptidase [Myxococcota bacterium]
MSAPSRGRWLLALLRDEVTAQLRRPSPWAFAAMYAAIGMLFVIAAGGAFEGVQVGVGGGNTDVDSPFAVTSAALVLSLFAVMNVAAVAGGAACRDVEQGMHPLVYSTPVPRGVFLWARFLGALVVCGVIVAGIPAGILVGAKLPLLEPERFGSWDAMSAVVALAGWILPNVVFTAGLFFALAGVTRRMFPNYIGGVLLLVGYLGAQALIRDLDNEALSALIDPFGFGAFDLQTRYWSPHERNVLLPWPTGWSLANRALWLGIGLSALASTFRLFRFDHDGWRLPTLRRAPPAPETTAVATVVPTVPRRFDPPARLVQLFALTARAVRDVLGHRYFWAFVAATVLFQLLYTQVIGTLWGTDTWPVTYGVLMVLEGTLQLFVVVILTFYAGDLVWHERDLGTDALYDALPVPDWMPLAAKVVALVAVVAGLHLPVPIIGVLVQLSAGFHDLQPGLYAASLALSLVEWVPFVALALAVHVVVNDKIVGHVANVLLWVALTFRGALGFEYHLFWFGASPGREWSDMNRWGDALGPHLLYQALWWAVGLGLLVVARLLWVRGTDPGLRGRLREARRRLDRATVGTLGGSVAVSAGLAAVIVYDSAVVHPYVSSVDGTRQQVRYEREYQADWADAPHPRVTDVDLRLDLYPRQGRLRAEGTLALENRSGEPVARMLVSTPTSSELLPEEIALSLDVPSQWAVLDDALGLREVTLDPPLPPGGRATLAFTFALAHRGFDNAGHSTVLVDNGTFVPSSLVLPGLGYERGYELADKAERRKYGLPERPRMLDLDDPVGRTRNYISDDADRVAFRAVVSTDADQHAVAPGARVEEHVEEHVEGDRRVATFEAERPILYLFAFLSARWDHREAKAGDVDVSVWYHPTHTYNVDRMLQAATDSLEAYGRRFSPFQYRELRIVEFPRYATFAQSFPSNIPFSEAIGFVARVVDPDEDIDYPYYVTAHEVAHQWWAHQVISADTQGATVLVETLAQYSALTQMEAEFGPEHVYRFLRYEQDRYFSARAVERDKEVPLMRVENQGYVHYQKGGVVMYALARAVGQERLDAALQSFLLAWRDRGPPYPTARDLVDHLRAALPDAGPLLTDTFERIVLWQNRATAATARPNGDGTWTVTLTVRLEKTESDAVGRETALPVDEEIEVGVYAGTREAREPLRVERVRLQGPEATVTWTVPSQPTLAGIDPDHLLLDRDRDDNLVAVTTD